MLYVYTYFCCAVDWSLKGNLVAVARKNTLSIMSLKLKEKVSISLSFDSWIGDSNLNFSVKGTLVDLCLNISVTIDCHLFDVDLTFHLSSHTNIGVV